MNFEKIKSLLEKKILILDGPMGTMIQKRKLMEKDFRGKKFNNFKNNLQGNNDILNLSNEKIIYEIHSEFLDAGADIIETNTFNAVFSSLISTSTNFICFCSCPWTRSSGFLVSSTTSI